MSTIAQNVNTAPQRDDTVKKTLSYVEYAVLAAIVVMVLFYIVHLARTGKGAQISAQDARRYLRA